MHVSGSGHPEISLTSSLSRLLIGVVFERQRLYGRKPRLKFADALSRATRTVVSHARSLRGSAGSSPVSCRMVRRSPSSDGTRQRLRSFIPSLSIITSLGLLDTDYNPRSALDPQRIDSLSVDLVRVLGHYFDLDLPRLPDQSVYSSWEDPYEFSEIRELRDGY